MRGGGGGGRKWLVLGGFWGRGYEGVFGGFYGFLWDFVVVVGGGGGGWCGSGVVVDGGGGKIFITFFITQEFQGNG